MIQEIYNEEKYAKQIEQYGFLTNYHNYELILLVKYWKQIGIKPKQRKEKLYEFCEKYIENFNDVLYFKKINSALREGSKKDNPLIIIESIFITKQEVEYFNNLNIDYIYKKILFTLLVQMKIKKEICRLKYNENLKFNYIKGNQNTYNEIFEVSKISNQTYKINNIINELETLEYIDVRTRGRINLTFMYNIKESNEIVFEINTFNNIGYYFDWYNGNPKIINCSRCNRLIKISSNNQKFCSDCWKDIRREYKTQKQREYRSFVDT